MSFKVLPLAAMLAVAAPVAHAATATGTLNLSITIAATCSVVSATAINFGTVSAIAANIDQTSTLTVNCSTTTPYNVGLSAGGGTGATVAARKMMNGANSVTYSLYRDSGYTQVWGNTVGTDTVAGTGTAANQTITIYGRVTAQTVPPPGSYTDAVTVTITY
jgi:spore coat protein U-like protein